MMIRCLFLLFSFFSLQVYAGFFLSEIITERVIHDSKVPVITPEFYRSVKKLIKSNEHKDVINAYNSIHSNASPLFSIRECANEKCPMNRELYPWIRLSFETLISNNSSFFSKNDTITYTSLNTNRLYSELVMISRIAYKLKTYKKHFTLKVNLIDKEYEQYINNPQGSRFLHKLFCQFMQWIKLVERDVGFPIEVYIYPNVNEYVTICKIHPELKAHLLAALHLEYNEIRREISESFSKYLQATVHRLVCEGTQDHGIAYIAACYLVKFGQSDSTLIDEKPFIFVRAEDLYNIDHSAIPLISALAYKSITSGRTEACVEKLVGYKIEPDRTYSEYDLQSVDDALGIMKSFEKAAQAHAQGKYEAVLPIEDIFCDNFITNQTMRMHFISVGCNTCGKSGNHKKCASCMTVMYCSRECQKKDWSRHKTECARLQKKTDTQH